MRVLLIANTLPPTDISGVGEQVLQLAAGLRERGHEVELLSRTSSGAGRLKVLFPVTLLPRLLQYLRRFRPHVVQVHESDGAFAALLTATVRALLEPRPAIVALLQVSYVEEWRAVRSLRFDGRVLGRPGARELRFKWLKAPLQILLGLLTVHLSDIVAAPSRRTAGELERDYLARRVRILPNVMGGRDIAEDSDADLPGVDSYLLYVGRLRIRKGVEVLLESLARLGEEAPSLLIVGEGEHWGRLQRRVERLALGSRVHFLGRRTPGAVRVLMRRASGLVVPSIYEGMPLVILEAMECALPVIATRVSGIPEVVEDGLTGWLVPAEDPVALAGAIRELVRDPGVARARGEAGRRRLIDAYGSRQAAEIWDRILVESSLAPAAESVAR